MLRKIYYYIGKLFESKKKWEYAIKFYLKAYKDDIAIVNYRLGFCYEKRKDYGNAIYFFNKAIKLEGKKYHWYFHLINSYINIGNDKESRYYLNIVNKLNPKNKKTVKMMKEINNLTQKRIFLLRSEGKGVEEEDIFIKKISLDSKYLQIYIKGNLDITFDTEKILIECKTRNHTNTLPKQLIVNKYKINIDTYGLFELECKISLEQLSSSNTRINSIWDFYFIADKKTRIKCFETLNNTFQSNLYDFIPYVTSKQTFSLVSIRKNIILQQKTKKSIMLVISDFSSKTDTVGRIIELANALSMLKFNVTLTCLDLKALPNYFTIYKSVNIDYVSVPFHRKKQDSLNFNKNTDTYPTEYMNALKRYFENIDIDILYTPVFGGPIFKTISMHLPKDTKLVVGDYSQKRESIYEKILNEKTDISLDLLAKKTKTKYLFDAFKNIDILHIENKDIEKYFKKYSTFPSIISCNINNNPQKWVKLLRNL